MGRNGTALRATMMAKRKTRGIELIEDVLHKLHPTEQTPFINNLLINYLWFEEDLSDNAGPGLGLRISCGIGLGDEDELHELLAPELLTPELELEGEPQRSSLQPLDSLYKEYG